MTRSVLIVSPYFPPSALAGVHRARHLVKHLPSCGWHPKVVCVHERFYEQPPDFMLRTLIPRDADVVSVNAIPLSWTRPLGLGEISLRAYVQLRKAVLDAVVQRHVQAVFITGSPYYPMLLTSAIRSRGVPVVLDFQDPWVSNWGATRPRMSKAGLSHWLATKLEPVAVRSANFITSVSDRQNHEMRQRHPELAADKFAAIPIGGDPEDFSRLGATGSRGAVDLLADGKINLSFVGTFMPRSGPLMRAFLSGVSRFRTQHPSLADRMRINFIGTGNHSGATEARATEIARDLKVADLVFELPQRIAFSRAIAALAQSDAALLVGSDEPHYTASKIYPGLMCGRPFLSLFHSASSSHRILQDAGGGIAIAWDAQKAPDELDVEVAAALRTLVSAPQSLGLPAQQAYAAFEAKAVAEQFAAIFDRVVACASQS